MNEENTVIEIKNSLDKLRDDVTGWHHQLNGHESEQTLGDSEGQGSWASCRPWIRKESGMTEQMNNNRSA